MTKDEFKKLTRREKKERRESRRDYDNYPSNIKDKK